jgi:malate permease and related proteins
VTAVPAVLSLLVTVVAPVFAVIAVGALLAKRFRIEVRAVNRLAIYGAVPALTFRTLADLDLSADAIGQLLLGYAVFLAATAAVGTVLGRRFSSGSRRAFVATALFGNAANMMLPIALFAFGPAGLQRALVLYVATALLMFSLGPLLLGQRTDPLRALRTVLTFPVLWAALVGLAVGAAGVTLPLGAVRAIDLLADAAIPLVLLSLGVHLGQVSGARPKRVNVAATAFKLLGGPLLGYAAGRLVGMSGLDLMVLTTLAAMPTAINAAMLALEFGGDADQVGRTVVTSTLAALLTLPLVLSVVMRLA